MTSKTKDQIKAFFETGDRPTQAQFIDLIDSYVDKSGPLGVIESAASGLATGVPYFTAGVGGIASYAALAGLIGVITTAEASAAAGVAISNLYASTALATAGSSSTGIMTPVNTRNAIQAFAFTSANYATTAQGNAGTDATTVMNPVLVRNAIAANGSASGLTLIETLTPGSVTSIDSSAFPTTYNKLVIQWSGVSCATNTRAFKIKPAIAGVFGGTDVYYEYYKNGASAFVSAGIAFTPYSSGDTQSTANTSKGCLIIEDYSSATVYKRFSCYEVRDVEGTPLTFVTSGVFLNTSAINKIRCFWSQVNVETENAVNFDAGTISIYGSS